MEVQIVAKEVIKPSLPTIKTYKLSSLDQKLIGCIYFKPIFFYKNISGIATEEMITERTRCLKASLSEVLTHYYPLAGKTKDRFSVCIGEDDGAEFIEARVNGTLSQYFAEPGMNLFLPQLVSDDYWESSTRPLLITQASFFTCGGLAIGINISHRVSDGSTLTCFMNAWASKAFGKLNNVVRPDFSASLVFPPSDQLSLGVEALRGVMSIPNVVSKRIVFSASNISSLQKKATKKDTPPPSRALTISAFLWRIGMKLFMSKSSCFPKPSTLVMPVNLRNFLPLPICEQSFGNLAEGITVHNHSGDTELANLVCLLRENIEKLRKTYKDKILQGERCFTGCLENTTDSIELASGPDVSSNFNISSWCRFPLYDADFGWGKPTLVAIHILAPNWIWLIDSSDGTGIEAWVSLVEADMGVFGSDEELLTYTTIDHNVH